MLYALALITAILVIEHVLAAKWNAFYFSYGIPVFSYWAESPKAPTHSSTTRKTEKERAELNFTPLVGRRIEEHVFALRESLWAPFNQSFYTPVIHGKVELDPNGGVHLTCFVNWTALEILTFFVLLTVYDVSSSTDLVWVLFPFLAFGGILLIQKPRFIRAADGIAAGSGNT